MVNTDDFIKRLEIILDYYALSASGFADKIGVQRSSLSHLLSGRNKPSLDFIMKILEVFPEVDLYWIMNGKGNFPKNEDKVSSSEKINIASAPFHENSIDNDLFSNNKNLNDALDISKNINRISENIIEKSIEDEIEKIMVFYKNGKFKAYSPK